MRARVMGAGVVGLCCAVELQNRGLAVEVLERAPALGEGACSWLAGGMLAPGCEQESAEPLVGEWGEEAAGWWESQGVPVSRRGSLVLAPPRDRADLERFAARSQGWTALDADLIGALEPDLAGRHAKALFFKDEAHLDPRRALAALAARLGPAIRWGVEADPTDASGVDLLLDCRGYAAAPDIPDLRAVRGEMLVLRQPEITISRPIRLLHPRFPVYVVPRGDGIFMIGATMVESESRAGVTARSAMELLSAVWSLTPAFGEAEIIEMGANLRPAFPDNLPAFRRDGAVWRVNGLYRHGFLLSPAVARRAVEAALQLEPACA
jgi:glycine oxidase